jgi:hypothetical protein
MEPESSLPQIQMPATCQCPEPITEIIFLLITSLAANYIFYSQVAFLSVLVCMLKYTRHLSGIFLLSNCLKEGGGFLPLFFLTML